MQQIQRKTKPKKEIFHAFKSYMDTRFQPKRMPINKQNAHCYVGIKLREAEYKKKFSSSDDDIRASLLCSETIFTT